MAAAASRSGSAPRPARGALPVVCRASGAAYGSSSGGANARSSGSSSGSSGPSGDGTFAGGAAARSQQPDAAQAARRLADLQELLRESMQIAVATGPRGIARSAQAASALLSVARDQAQRLQSGQQPESPAAILRTVKDLLLRFSACRRRSCALRGFPMQLVWWPTRRFT